MYQFLDPAIPVYKIETGLIGSLAFSWAKVILKLNNYTFYIYKFFCPLYNEE